MPLDEDERLALVPDVIAGGDDVGACVKQLCQDLLGDAEPASRVLAIDHHEMRAVALAQARQQADECRPARPADHVTEKHDPHVCRQSAKPTGLAKGPPSSIAQTRALPPALRRGALK